MNFVNSGRITPMVRGNPRPETIERRVQIWMMRSQGMQIIDIARELGLNVSSVGNHLAAHMAEIMNEPRERLLQYHIERGDRLFESAQAIFDKAADKARQELSRDGTVDHKTLEVLLKANARQQQVSESMRKLLGLDALDTSEIQRNNAETEAEISLKQRITALKAKNALEIEGMQGSGQEESQRSEDYPSNT